MNVSVQERATVPIVVRGTDRGCLPHAGSGSCGRISWRAGALIRSAIDPRQLAADTCRHGKEARTAARADTLGHLLRGLQGQVVRHRGR
jgi:hypothetical protein